MYSSYQLNDLATSDLFVFLVNLIFDDVILTASLTAAFYPRSRENSAYFSKLNDLLVLHFLGAHGYERLVTPAVLRHRIAFSGASVLFYLETSFRHATHRRAHIFETHYDSKQNVFRDAEESHVKLIGAMDPVKERENCFFSCLGNLLFDTQKSSKVLLALCIFVVCIGIGVFLMHFVEKIGWFDSFYFSFMGVTSVGYGAKVFESIVGRIFGSIWLVVSIIVVVRVFILFVEVRVDERQRKVDKWVMEQDMTVDQFHDGFVSKSDYMIYKLKELGKFTEKDILLINKQFERLDTGNCGRITLSNII
ncbi:LOW QUALITY PROTEIN: two pore potassium channel c [Solanum tuberosum]|uniref:LOW QUALITY PROTEIN: two pore potassium channel c n=1 Tax=Solanum tuberosum TaxID=4113 RepID=UPI00073A52AA|nr:PREDICTED: LOW QUALITY PROTEIN: two pore potassium channel c [Solanum tuberosum]